MLIRFWLLLVTIINLVAHGSTHTEASNLSLLQTKLPEVCFDNIAEYIMSVSDLNAFRITCNLTFRLVNVFLHRQLLEIMPELATLYPRHLLIFISLPFRHALRQAKLSGFDARGSLRQSDLVALLLWSQMEPDTIYLSTSTWRKLNTLSPDFFVDGSVNTCAGVIYASPSILKRQVLSDCVAKQATRATFYIGSHSSPDILDALFQNLLVYVRYKSDLHFFEDSVQLLLPRLRENLDWFQLCLDKQNIALFDALVAGFVVDAPILPAVTQIYQSALFQLCKSGLSSQVLVNRREIPDEIIPNAMSLCIKNGNWHLASDLLRLRHPSTFSPQISFPTATALRFFLFEDRDGDEEAFSAESFHARFGVQEALLQLVAELGFPNFFVLNRFEILYASGQYQVARSANVKPKYLKIINKNKFCSIN